MIDALERVRRLSSVCAAPAWKHEDFRRAADEGKRRWQEIEESLGIQYPMFEDAIAELDPSFQLPAEEESLARSSDVPGQRNVDGRIAVWFLKWERCPLTTGLPNPYEPWISIWEHGGKFSVEHGQFVDIYAHDGMHLGCVVVRRA